MVGPKANVWCPYTKRRGPRRVGHVKREAEIGGYIYKPRNAKDCQKLPEARRKAWN